MFCVVTGGAGFIGSHLVDALVARGDRVLVIDDLRAGSRENLAAHLESGAVELCVADLLGDGWQEACRGADLLYHLAADPDVRGSARSPQAVFDNNVTATERVLEAMRTCGIPGLVFTSTSTVYGEATTIPTPENYAPLEPISVYAATKLAGEALISAYCATYGMRAWVFRFANIIGPRSGHGVIKDFIDKLRADPGELEILGDGRQSKSYLDVRACIGAMQCVVNADPGPFAVYNIGSEDWVDVRTIADTVVREMGLEGVAYRFTGGDRGWVGDVPRMLLSVEKLRNLGWQPEIGSAASVSAAVRAMLQSG
ncbi:MAG: NAD-dependent epimerase/dehydratase family protein [Methanomicrobiales archaeon]|nr:NAD-dependent epimerase/dehydratase family protein [Methanomicrobiales archaeon]